MGIHGLIEFGNRTLTGVLCVVVGALIIIARCQRNPDRAVLRASWIQFWIVVLNAVVGGVTVLARLSPYVVAGHFIAAMLLLTAAVYTVELVGRHDRPNVSERVDQQLKSRARWLVACTALLVVVGAAVTGSGIHAGDSSDVQRMPFDWTAMVILHGVAASATFVVGVLVWLSARAPDTKIAEARVRVFLALFVAQGLVGVLQALSINAELLVVVHMLGASLIWTGALRVLYATTPNLGSRVEEQEAGAPASRSKVARTTQNVIR